jgi:hypothetical protein
MIRRVFTAAAAVVRDSPATSEARGAVFSTAQASRWFASGRWTSQHDTEQNTNPVLFRLHVETLHTQ